MRMIGSSSNQSLISIGASPAIGIGQRALGAVSARKWFYGIAPLFWTGKRETAFWSSVASRPSACLTHISILAWWNGAKPWAACRSCCPKLIWHLSHAPASIFDLGREIGTRCCPALPFIGWVDTFEGSSVLEWEAGADQNGVLLTGDTDSSGPGKGMGFFPCIPLPQPDPFASA